MAASRISPVKIEKAGFSLLADVRRAWRRAGEVSQCLVATLPAAVTIPVGRLSAAWQQIGFVQAASVPA